MSAVSPQPARPPASDGLVEGLEGFYAGLEAKWAVRADHELLASLVVPNGNGTVPVHRWFRMKEAYSCNLLDHVLERADVSRNSLTIVDPYAGCGTTLTSLAGIADVAEASFYGVEANPFLHLVADAKFGALRAPPSDFDDLAQVVAARALQRTEATPQSERPALSTLNNEAYIAAEGLDELLRLREAIDVHQDTFSREAVQLARLCLGAAVEPSTKLRRDGRALRYEADKSVARPVRAFLDRANTVVDDLPVQGVALDGEVVLGDARADVLPDGVVDADLVVFSPPYPNNIDYTEIYKMELWLLGFVADADEFAEQRRRTVRSHPSLKVESQVFLHHAAHSDEIDALIERLLAFVPDGNRYSSGRKRTVEGYLRDMASSLGHLVDRMAPGAPLVYVVGNSYHGSPGSGSFLFAADLLLARLAEFVGLEVEQIDVARVPSRRSTSSRFLRESIVLCRKSGVTA